MLDCPSSGALENTGSTVPPGTERVELVLESDVDRAECVDFIDDAPEVGSDVPGLPVDPGDAEVKLSVLFPVDTGTDVGFAPPVDTGETETVLDVTGPSPVDT